MSNDEAFAPDRPSVICDMHSDVMMDVYLRSVESPSTVLEKTHKPKMARGGVNFHWFTVGGDWWRMLPEATSPTGLVLEMLSLLFEATAGEGSSFQIVTAEAEVIGAVERGKIALLLTIEGGMALGRSLRVLDTFYRLGVRSLGLTHRYRNSLADGNQEARTGSGLTGFGVAVVKEMNHLGMIVDISHLSGKAVDEVLSLSSSPIVASHSNARALHDHVRNLPDSQLRGVAATGGVVGVNFVTEYLGKEEVGLELVLNQIDYLVELLGMDHVGLGPDFVDYLPDAPSYPLGAEDISAMGAVLDGLARRGYGATQIAKIAGGNALRVCQLVLG